MMCTEMGYLGQMGNTHHLLKTGQIIQFLSHLFRHPASDTCIHFIKDNRLHGILGSQ